MTGLAGEVLDAELELEPPYTGAVIVEVCTVVTVEVVVMSEYVLVRVVEPDLYVDSYGHTVSYTLVILVTVVSTGALYDSVGVTALASEEEELEPPETGAVMVEVCTFVMVDVTSLSV